MSDELERRYRRLLRFYPATYRRRRSGEIIDTLMQDAAAGQRRPTARSAVALAVGGLRARSDVDRAAGIGGNVRLVLRQIAVAGAVGVLILMAGARLRRQVQV